MADIETLIDDIYGVLDRGVDLTPFHHEQGDQGPRLRLSSIGQPCSRKLWYEVNSPDDKEELRPETKLQFAIGHISEHVVLDLARQAGHTVEHEQEEVELNGVPGHIDAIIDGFLIDVKSASPYSFTSFETGLKGGEDKFGYLTQLNSYLSCVRGGMGGVEVNPNTAGFLVINKVTGKLCLDLHTFTERELERNLELIEERKRIVEDEATVPPRAFDDKPIGKSGNRGLDTNCSYCNFKDKCWPNLRTFLYSNGPVFLTEVRRTPDVPEVI